MLEDRDLRRFERYKEPGTDRELDNGDSLRKILSSHLSIYNALTNPDLELSPRLGGNNQNNAISKIPSNNTPHNGGTTSPSGGTNVGPTGSFYVDESWQSISNDSIIDPRIFENPQNGNQRILDPKIFRTLSNSPVISQQQMARPSSLLSITTDEDGHESDKKRNSPHDASCDQIDSSAMVFETDEEDEFKQYESNDNVFIMPKMSMSQDHSKKLTVTLLSSYNVNYINETNQLINSIRHELNDNVNLLHLSLDKRKSINADIIKKSDLIFIVNDGSFIFIDQLNKVFTDLKKSGDVSENEDEYGNDSLPKVTVINMMTVNYFINLFELINSLKPYQIWKTSSLNHHNLLIKFKQFIEFEAGHSVYSPEVTTEGGPNMGLSISVPDQRNNSVYSSLISHKRPNYKLLEKKFKSELLESSRNIDPLNLKKFSWLNSIYALLRKAYFSSEAGQEHDGGNDRSSGSDEGSKFPMYALASFTIGIALGIGVAASFSSIVSLYVSNGINNFSQLAKPEPKLILKESKLDSSIATKILDQLSDLKIVCEDSLAQLFSAEFVNEVSDCLSSILDTIKHTSSLMVNGVKGGFEKLMVFLSF